MECERYFVEYNNKDKDESRKRCISYKILNNGSKKNIYYADPGSGKSYTLWMIAKKLLEQGEIIPLFLPLGNLSTWDEVLTILSSVSPQIDPKILINQPNICLCLDGWSEFATGQYFSERTKAIIAMNSAYIIANARYPDASDGIFHRWNLENIELSTVIRILKISNLEASNSILDFLKNPLSLLLFIFLNGGTSIGELLQKFHNHITDYTLPESFHDILCKTVCTMILKDELNYFEFETELKKYAQETNISEPIKLLKQLGTIKERNGKILPIHDLYLSWLGGIGIFKNHKLKDCACNLKLHESINLALESGENATFDVIRELIPQDIYLAVKLNKQKLSTNIDKQLNKMFNDPRLSIRYRAAITVISCSIDKYIQRALDIISELYENKIYIKELKTVFKPTVLYKYTKELKKWAGSCGTHLLFEAIIESGKSEWLPWLKDIINKESINKYQVVAAAIACSCHIPEWCYSYLKDFIKEKSYQLRTIKFRGANKDLTKWLLENYEDIIISNSCHWCHINEYLVHCAEEEDFQKILTNYNKFNKRAQELIEYAIADRGEPWIGKLQKMVFSEPQNQTHHHIRDILSLEIDDDVARQWIENGHLHEGWRVLVCRHQEAIIPELIEKLPKTFNNQHYIPTLSAMEYLKKAPNELINEVYSRFNGTMQPMATQDAITAIGKAYAGMGFLAKLTIENPSWLPAFHIRQIIRMYTTWSKENGIGIMLKTQNGNEFSFIDHLVYIAYHYHKNDFLFGDIVSYKPEFAIELVLSDYRQNDKKAAELLNKLKPIASFDKELFNRMISSKLLAPIIPTLFSEVLNLFPTECFLQLINSKYIQIEKVLWKLSNANSINYKNEHIQIIKQILQCKININNYYQLSNMLRYYSRDEIFDILELIHNHKNDNFIFFVRELENVRQERLIDERGNLLRKKKCYLKFNFLKFFYQK